MQIGISFSYAINNSTQQFSEAVQNQIYFKLDTEYIGNMLTIVISIHCAIP